MAREQIDERQIILAVTRRLANYCLKLRLIWVIAAKRALGLTVSEIRRAMSSS